MVMLDELLGLYSEGVLRTTITVPDPLLLAFRKSCAELSRDLDTNHKELIGRYCWQTAWAISDWDDTWKASLYNPLDNLLKYHQSLSVKIEAVKNAACKLAERDNISEEGQRYSNNFLQSQMIEQLKKAVDENKTVRCYGTKQSAAIVAAKTSKNIAEVEKWFVWKSELWKNKEIYDVLIICGPLRSLKIPDMIVTAPRWKKLINIRYTFDRNSYEFGISPETVWSNCKNNSCPVNVFWPDKGKEETISHVYEKNRIDGAEEGTWDMDELEKLLYPKNQRNKYYSFDRHGIHEPEQEMIFCLKVEFENGVYMLVPVNKKRSANLPIFDPKAPINKINEKKIEILPDDNTLEDEIDLAHPGMYVISWQEAIGILGTIGENELPQDGIDRYYMNQWKKRLEEESRLKGLEKVATMLNNNGVEYAKPGTVQQWIRNDSFHTFAPKDDNVFGKLIITVLGFDEKFCRNAWKEIQTIRGDHISRGHQNIRIREDWLLKNLNIEAEEISRQIDGAATYTWKKDFNTRSGRHMEIRVDFFKIKEISEMDYLVSIKDCYSLEEPQELI